MVDKADDALRHERNSMMDDLLTAMQVPADRRHGHSERFAARLDAYIDARIAKALSARAGVSGPGPHALDP